MNFSELQLSKSLQDSIAKNGFNKTYPVQAEIIPNALLGKDILGIAPTGSGKTASFVLPIIEKLINSKPDKNRFIESLIIVPTRELAMQIEEVFKQFSNGLENPIKAMAVYGGVSINPQMKRMMGVRCLIATPGRLLELKSSNALNLSRCSTLVLDEADKLLNLGFKEEMNQILELLPKSRQNLLFSATLSDKIAEIQDIVLNNPIVVKIEQKEETVSLIDQTGYFVSEEKKGPLLRYLIENGDWKQVLIFTSSTYKADNVADKLRKNGFSASAIHSKKSQGARTSALAQFKNGEVKILVTTDLLARGIDIDFLPYVVNYELPRSPKDYVHRIGRTGRAENPGKAISFVTEEDKHHFRVIQKKAKTWVTMVDSDNLDF